MSISAILDLLKDHYDQEVSQRETNSSPSRVYPKKIQELDPEASKWTFGCTNLLSHLDYDEVDGKRILDFGCGAGSDMIYLQRLFQPAEIVGIDLASAMIKKANDHFQARGFTNLIAKKIKLEELAPDKAFDLILSNAVIHLNPEKEKIFNQLYELTSENGSIIISDFVVSNELPQFMKQHYQSTDGLFLFGGLIPIDNYVDLIHQAGYEEVERLELIKFSPHKEIKTLLDSTKLSAEELKSLDSIDFFILALKCKKFLPSENIAYSCQTCTHLNPMKFYRSLNLEIHKNLGKKLLRGEINLGNCDQCQSEEIPAPYQVHHMGAKKMCFVFPGLYRAQAKRLEKEILETCQNRLSNYEMDLCFSYTELLEFLQ